MKILNKIIYTAGIVSIAFTSCKDDFLEDKKDYSGMNEQVFKDAALAKGYVDYVYGLFLPPANSQALTWNLATTNDDFTKTTDELAGETNWNKVWTNISYQNAHALSYFGARLSTSLPNNPYTRLKQINTFLKEIDKHGLDEETTRPLKGQLLFWRAYQYFDLVRLYGGVPMVLSPQDPIAGNDDTQVPRTPTSESIEIICADLDSATNMLPGKWPGTADWGRITSGGAAALKGRVLLTWASPLFNRNDDVSRWQRAYDANLAAKTLLEKNGFGLFKTGGTANGTAWGNMWFTEVNNPEAVIVYGFNSLTTGNPQKNSGWEQAIRSKELNGGGSISPTKQIVESFPMKDGKMINEASTYTYDPKKFYKNRDPRFYKTFIYNGALWPYVGVSGAVNTYRQWTYVWKKSGEKTPYTGVTETKGANSSGIYLAKASSPSASNVNGNFLLGNSIDFMEMRFAEVVLNLAESAVGINKLSEGLDLIKTVRDRAGVENRDGAYGLADYAGTRNKMFAAVLNERKIELAYEGKRFWDLRRWLLFDDTYGTVSRLGFTPLNGTRRTGYRIIALTATGAEYTGNNDPFIKSGSSAPVIDRDATTFPTGITTYDQYLDLLYDRYFKIVEKDDLDKTDVANWSFKWYPEYYFFGLNESVLSSSKSIEQTQGWNSLSGMGTFDPLK